jgi:hypothetical protein
MPAQYVYDIGGNYYSLSDIEHGILLAKLSLPDAPLVLRFFLPLRKLAPDDPRVPCQIEVPEPLLHFCLSPCTMSSGRITVYRPDTLREQMHAEAVNFLRRNIQIEPHRRRVTLPAVMQWFGIDFGATMSDRLAYLAARLPETELSGFLSILFDSGGKV